jgi:LCP family protein required for cell wall assembly
LDNRIAPQGPVTPRYWTPLRIAGTLAGLIVLGFIAIVAGFSVAFHRSPFQIVEGQFTPTPEELFHKDRILVLIEGLDYDYNDKDEEFSSQSRSDVIKAVDLDFRTDNVYVLSIPRDMDAVLPNGNESKINQAQADGGVREAQAVISKWLGIPGFDRYVLLRINTTKDLINAIGGIDIDPKNSDALTHTGPNGPIDYDDNWGHLHIHFKPGMQHMTGDQAVSYARFRHDWCSDPCRILRQNQVMQAALNKIKSDKFNTLVHLNDIIGVFNKDVQTNLTRDEEIALATEFAHMPKNGLHTDTAGMPYVATKELPYAGEVLVPDESKKERQVERMLLNPPVPTASPAPGQIAAINPSTLRVDVENGSGMPGIARRIAGMLRKQGFTIAGVGNASSSDLQTSQLHEHSKVAFAGLKVREALGKPAQNLQVVDDAAQSAQSDVTIIVGQDLANALAAQVSSQP